VYGAILTAML